MPYWIITFFLGIYTLSFCHKLPSLYWLLMLLPIICLWFISSNKLKKIFFYLVVFVLGFFWVLVYTHWVTAWSLPQTLEGKNLLITGYIASIPAKKMHGMGFEFQTETVAGAKKHPKLKLSWYGGPSQLNAGDKWQLLVRLKRPHGVLNPGGFDAEKHFLIHHIRAQGYVVNSESNRLLSSHLYHYSLTRLRQFLIDKMEQALISDPLAPVIIAFVTGAEDKITKSQWQVMRDTGTSYLVAISGLHIGLVASIVFVFVQFLWKFSGCWSLTLPARSAGISAGLFIGFLYAAVSGFSIPTQRALVMLVMFSLTTLLRRHTSSWNAWLWSVFLVLIINPLAVLTIGFWLSFLAVFAIIYVGSGRIKASRSHFGKFWRMQFTVTLALLPLTLLFFQQVSFVTLVANLIAMPGVCLIIVPMSLLGALCLLLIPGSFGGFVLWCSAELLHIIWWWLTLLANFFSCSWYHPIYNSWILIAASAGVLILLAPRGFPGKYLGLLLFAPLFFYAPKAPDADNKFWFTLLDVGQGLASVVQTKNHVLLYDTGLKFFESDTGSSVIIPYLRNQGIGTIDAMVVSHGDSDHSGGALSILKAHPVMRVLTSVPENFALYKAEACSSGQHWQWDGVDFQMLFPPKDSSLVGNNGSCVLKVTSGKNSILLPGDIERVAEDLLVENNGVDLKSMVLVAPHHGSATSSTDGLIAAVKPQYVIFPVGYKNRFRFPSKKIVARYMKSKAILFNATETGAITFKFDDKSDILGANFYREEAKRFWHDV